jgi:hypothetical protein
MVYNLLNMMKMVIELIKNNHIKNILHNLNKEEV